MLIENEMKRPTISILTPSYNQGSHIERNILSILKQNYQSFEHIVIDGGSTDNTVELLKKYPHLKWISEKDKGQADALNKGLKIATGEIIGWINSDDFYEPNIFNDVVMAFEDTATKWVIGNVSYFYEESNLLQPHKSFPITHKNLLKDPDILKQPATFFRRSIIEQVGGWDVSLHYVMDYDLWLKIVNICEPKLIDNHWANFTIQKTQKSLCKNILKQFDEMNKVMRRNGASFSYTLRMAVRKHLILIRHSIKSYFYNT